MRKIWIAAVVTLSACGGGGGNDDKAACEALRDAQGEDEGVYAEVAEMDISDKLRTAVSEVENISEEEITSEAFEKAAVVMAHCQELGVSLSSG